MSPEFSRPLATDRIGAGPVEITIEANEAERAALARRFAIPAVLALRCAFVLRRRAGGATIGAAIEAEGRLTARVVRTCVITLEDFEADAGEAFALRFVPAGEESDDPDPEATDEVPYAAGALDLGEAAAEQLALALDPYPRMPGAALPEEAQDAAEASPFGRLAGLRRDG